MYTLTAKPECFSGTSALCMRNVYTYSETRMLFRYSSPLCCGMCALTAKPERVSATASLYSAECVHVQRNPNVLPLQQPSVVRKVRTYIEIRMRFRYTHECDGVEIGFMWLRIVFRGGIL